MIIQYFPPSLRSEEQIKAFYKALVRVYHPDVPGGDTEIMQIINDEYSQLEKNNFIRPALGQQHMEPPKEKINLSIKYKGDSYNLNSENDLIELFANYVKNNLKR